MNAADVKDPYLKRPFSELDALHERDETLCLRLGYPAQGARADLERAFGCPVELEFCPPTHEAGTDLRLPGVRNIIAVGSGKGGVGKSTVAVSLALALEVEGAKVGLLDADIYGPSQGLMLGVAEGRRPRTLDGQGFEPLRAHGLQAMSMSFLTTERTPMVWRGPMATGALRQLLAQTAWQDLDYLIVDMPPGTGDIQLTMAQSAPVAGAVIVTTPQDIAVIDARKSIEMFRKVDIPILGVVENMSLFQCTDCGAEHALFGDGGGARLADDYGVPLLGRLPLSLSVREATDAGKPVVSRDSKETAAMKFRDAARHMAARLWQVSRERASGPIISVEDD